MEAIKIMGLRKEFKDVVAVDNLSLSINEGELYSLLGVNGAGKSTTIRMLSCILKPTSGDAYILGHSIKADSKACKELIGVSMQETAVASMLSVKENLKLICGIYGLNKEETNKRIAELVEAFKLNDVLNKRSSKLSGGYQRRLSIAMSLVSKPKILFLDEPTLGLDVLARRDLWELIKDLKKNMTIILTTHYMEEAEALSDHVGIMKDGKLVASGTVDEIKAHSETNSFEDAFCNIIKEKEL